MTFSDFKLLVAQTFKEWSEDKAGRLAAALAYYTVFSLPPLLIIVLAISGRFFQNAEARLTSQITELVGPTGGDAITAILENAADPTGSLIASIIGFAMLLFGASGVFGQLQEAMNTIWEVPPQPGSGIIDVIKDRFFSFTMVFGVGFLLLVSLVISAFLSSITSLVSDALPSLIFLAQLINFVVSIGIITVLFALIFKVIPDVEVAWRDVWIGAFVTAVLFTAGKWAIGFYLSRSAPASTYGAAGSLIVILLWIHYSSQILFLGAEFTQVYANRYGSKIVADWQTETQTMPVRQAAGQEGHRILRPTLPAADVQNASNAPNNGRPGLAVVLADKLRPLARLINRYHQLLVTLFAIPIAIIQAAQEKKENIKWNSP